MGMFSQDEQPSYSDIYKLSAEIKELKELLRTIHVKLDKHPLKGFSLSPEEWTKLSSITGIKWPREPLTEEEIKQRNHERITRS